MRTAKLSQILRTPPGVVPQDITTARTGPFTDVSGCQRLLAQAITGALANGNTATLGLMQAQDATGTGAKPLGTPVVATATANGQTLSPSLDAQIDDLDINSGFAFVAVTLQSNGASPIQGGAVLILGENRFNPA